MTKQKIMTDDQIVKSIVSITRRSGTLQADIHKTAMSILARWQVAGASGAARAGELLTQLQAASPYHADSFSKWVAEFTDLLWAKETSTWYAPPKGVVIKGKRLVEAREKPFFEFKPASKPKPFEFFDGLEAFINRATNDLKKNGEKSTVDAKALAGLRELVRQNAD